MGRGAFRYVVLYHVFGIVSAVEEAFLEKHSKRNGESNLIAWNGRVTGLMDGHDRPWGSSFMMRRNLLFRDERKIENLTEMAKHNIDRNRGMKDHPNPLDWGGQTEDKGVFLSGCQQHFFWKPLKFRTFL